MKKIYIPIKHREALQFILDEFTITHEDSKDTYEPELKAAEYLLTKLNND